MSVDARYLDIAAYLKDARLARGISMRELADAVHIRERYIHALEAGQVELLPGEVYARGYIQRMLEFLEVDADAVLAEFDAVADEPLRKLSLLNMRWGDSPHPTLPFAAVCFACAVLLVVVVQTLRHQAPAPLIDAYSAQEQRPDATPTRCTQESAWPCYWEQMDYWYTQRVRRQQVSP